jgi:uncharacterized protein YecE (DUF72 family)
VGRIYIGTAAWTIPKACRDRFGTEGSHLECYARCLPGVEINTSFYRPHQPKTYARWARSVPHHFRFAVKVPRLITHELRLNEVDAPLERFLGEVQHLEEKLGPLLVQLPPRREYDAKVTADFFERLRGRFTGEVVCEPRHPTWFTPAAGRQLTDLQVARVAADPAVVPEAAEPGAWPGLIYFRLHGSPEMYYSTYSTDFLDQLAKRMTTAAANGIPVWCIFDNTALAAATANAVDLASRMGVSGAASPPPRG